MANTFNFLGDKLIIQLGNTDPVDMDVLYSRWKDWVSSGSNAGYPTAFRYVGGDPTVGGNALGVTYFIRNGWKIRPASTDHILQIDGNLFRDGGGNPFTPATGNVNVTIQQQVSNLVDQRVADSPIEDRLDYNGVVYLNAQAGQSGSLHPVGTFAQPSNNLADAVQIADEYGLPTISIDGDIFIDQDITGKTIGSNNISDTLLDISASASLVNITFDGIRLTGRLNSSTSGNEIRDSELINLENVNGRIFRSTLEGTTTIKSNQTTVLFIECASALDNNHDTILDLDGVVSSHISFRGFRGKLKVINMTDPNTRVDLDVDAGHIIIDSSNTDGTIHLTGTGHLDNNTGGATVDNDGFVNAKDLIDYLNKEGILGDVTVSKTGLTSPDVDLEYIDNGDGSITIRRTR